LLPFLSCDGGLSLFNTSLPCQHAQLRGPGLRSPPAAAAALSPHTHTHTHASHRSTTDGGAAPPDHVSPAASLAFKHAAQLFFSQLLGAQQRAAAAAALHPSRSSDSVASGGGGGGGGGELLVFRLETALQSPLAEVRCAALKVVGRAAAAGQLSAPGLRPLLWAQLDREACAKGRRRLLALLAALPPGSDAATPVCSSDDEDAFAAAGQTVPAAWEAEFFAVLRHAGGDGGDAATRRHAVRCLGPLAAAALRAGGGLPGDGGGAAAARAADALLALARQCAAPAQLPELRLAAAEALAASGLLALQPSQSDAAAEAAAAAWEALLQLVEDDDEEVRGAATAAAAAALATPGWAPAAAAAEAEAEAGCEPAAPCEERLLRRVLPALTARFGPHPALLSLLRRLCWAGGEDAAAGRGGGCAAAAEKLFDREPDNMHEEPLLLAQVPLLLLPLLLLFLLMLPGPAARLNACMQRPEACPPPFSLRLRRLVHLCTSLPPNHCSWRPAAWLACCPACLPTRPQRTPRAPGRRLPPGTWRSWRRRCGRRARGRAPPPPRCCRRTSSALWSSAAAGWRCGRRRTCRETPPRRLGTAALPPPPWPWRRARRGRRRPRPPRRSLWGWGRWLLRRGSGGRRGGPPGAPARSRSCSWCDHRIFPFTLRLITCPSHTIYSFPHILSWICFRVACNHFKPRPAAAPSPPAAGRTALETARAWPPSCGTICHKQEPIDLTFDAKKPASGAGLIALS
jgi:hypothetical protein